MRPAPRIPLAAAAFALSLALPQPSAADPAAERIARAQALVTQSAGTLRQARDGSARLGALGQAVSAHETALTELRAGLRKLAVAERSASARLQDQAEPLGRLLAALQSISRAPDSALLAIRGGPVEVQRAAILMAAVTPELDRRVAALDRDLDALRQLRRDQERIRDSARGALSGLQELRAAAAAAMGRRDRSGLPDRAALRAAAQTAAASARDLDGLAKALRAARMEQPPGTSFAEAKGRLPLPVAGRVAARFGAPDPWGRPGRGWTLEAADFAQVTAPFDATVRYAGPLIDYGQVVVLEPQAGYLVVLAGLARADRETGETVLAGEPLGDLGGPVPTGEQFLLDAAAQDGQIRRKALYVEIRRSGQALDPAEWFDLTGSEAIR